MEQVGRQVYENSIFADFQNSVRQGLELPDIALLTLLIAMHTSKTAVPLAA